jgi:hypothetical protein
MGKSDDYKGWTTWGDVRGLGPIRGVNERGQAECDLKADGHGCRQQGGYSDRSLYAIDADGYLVEPGTDINVYPYGRTHAALKVDLAEVPS